MLFTVPIAFLTMTDHIKLMLGCFFVGVLFALFVIAENIENISKK